MTFTTFALICQASILVPHHPTHQSHLTIHSITAIQSMRVWQSSVYNSSDLHCAAWVIANKPYTASCCRMNIFWDHRAGTFLTSFHVPQHTWRSCSLKSTVLAIIALWSLWMCCTSTRTAMPSHDTLVTASHCTCVLFHFTKCGKHFQKVLV